MFQLVLVFSSKQEVLFSYGASLLNTLIRDTRQHVGGEARHALEERDILMQLFSPLVASHMTMTETLKMPYECIETTGGHCILFKNRSDCVLIAICQRQSKSDECISEELERVEWIINSLVGPCWSRLCPESLQQRSATSRLLRILLDEMWAMESKEFNLMFSAIERMSLSESIKELGVDCMAQCMKRLKHSGDKRTKHILILIGSKLFCLYSAPATFRLSSNHMLLFVVLANALHNRHDHDSFTIAGAASDSFLSCVERSSEEEAYYSPEDESSIEDISEKKDIIFETESLNFTPRNSTPEPSVNGFNLEKSLPITRPTSQMIARVVSGGLRTVHSSQDCVNNNCGHITSSSVDLTTDTSQKPPVSTPDFDTLDSDDPEYLSPLSATIDSDISSISYRVTRLLLHSSTMECVPCNLHLLKLHSNIVLIGVEEKDFATVAGFISSQIRQLEDFLKGKISVLLLSQFTKMIHKIRAHVHRVPALISIVRLLDTQIVRLEKELTVKTEIVYKDLSMNVRTIVDNIYNGFSRAFSILFLPMPLEIDQRLCKTMIRSAKNTRKRLRDYLPFLSVKAERNLAPTGFYTMFPGLVHFIWINRATDEIIVPALDSDFLKTDFQERLWNTINWCRHQCHSCGYRDVQYRDTSLQYSLCIRSSNVRGSSFSGSVQDSQFELCLVHLACVPQKMVHHHQTAMIRTIVRRNEDTVISLGLLT